MSTSKGVRSGAPANFVSACCFGSGIGPSRAATWGRPYTSSSLTRIVGAADQGQAIADREHDVADARVVPDVVVEGDDRVVVFLLWVEDAAAPEDVVDGDDAVRCEQRQRRLVVVGVVA